MSQSGSSARYRAIAGELRTRINAGVYAPGARLPAEDDLKIEFGVARNTIRQALDVLRAEGLVVTSVPQGTRVRQRIDERIVSLAPERYRLTNGPPSNPYSRDFNTRIGGGPVLDVMILREVALPDTARLLQIPAGTPVLRRDYVFFGAGAQVPFQMSSSFIPLDIVAGTAIEDPNLEPWDGGTVGQMASLGICVSRVRHTARARMPTRREVDVLKIPDLVPVIAITRTMLAGDRPVEVAHDMVMPADRTSLFNEVHL